MKKIMIISIVIILSIMLPKYVFATDHSNFEKITLSSGKLLDKYTSEELNSYYKKVNKSKFSGWKTYTINNKVDAKYVGETIFSYYNDGYTPIEYSYKLEEQESSKYSFNTAGSISFDSKSTKKVFKNGLDASLKISYSTDKTKTKKENYQISLKIDPGTQVNLYKEGTGKLTNGVAANYLFWIRRNLGGYEIFEISTSTSKLEKIRI